MKIACIVALFATGCTIGGEDCAPSREGMEPTDWVSPQHLERARREGVEACYVDQMLRRARFADCRLDGNTSYLSDDEQIEQCHSQVTDYSLKAGCLPLLAAAPCEELEAGPCALGGGLGPTCR